MSALAAFALVAALSTPVGPAGNIHECIARYPQIDAALKRAEAETGVPRTMVWAIAWVETRCDPNPEKPSAAGEVGMFQIIPRDQNKFPKNWFSGRPLAEELRDPFFSAREAGRILLKNMTRFCGMDLMCAARVYNGGTSKCVITGGRDSRAMPSFAESDDACAHAWRYATRVWEVAQMIKP